MNKLIKIFAFILAVMISPILSINAEHVKELIDIPVKVEVERVDHKVYANRQDIIQIEMSYQDDRLDWVYEDITLREEENFETIIKDLSKGKSIAWDRRYDFRLKGDNLKYYGVPTQIIRIDSGQVPFDSVVKYEIPLLKTRIEIDLKFGTSQNSYDNMCWYGADDGNGDEEDYSFFSRNSTNLANAKFKLLDEDGKLIKEQKTDENGKLTFENIPYGKYKVVQENAPEGFKINESEMDIDVDIQPRSEGCEYMVEWFNDEEPNVPVEEIPEVPVEETPEVPVEETPEVPVEDTPEVPVEETPEVPVEDTPEAPVEETPEVPVEDTPEVPVEDSPEVPAEDIPEAPVKETPESLPQTGISNNNLFIGVIILLSGLFILLRNTKNQSNTNLK